MWAWRTTCRVCATLDELSPPSACRLTEVQLALERLYGLEPGPAVVDFVQWVDEDEWETLLVRQLEGDVEVRLRLPHTVRGVPPAASDDYLQVVEGVSHFVLVAERARTELPTTLFELELQAEVDKFALLSSLADAPTSASLRRLHHWLYERATFLHAEGTTAGSRYRDANRLAAQLWRRLVDERDHAAARHQLRRFYRSGQSEKVRLALAA